MPTQDTTIPPGLCQCGCGQRTAIARTSWARYGWVKGQPLRYVHGHNVVGPLRYTVDEQSGCWLWGGAVTDDGYGVIQRQRVTLQAHRWMYQQVKGPIPENMELDHLCHTNDPTCAGGIDCRHRRCVNPDHLEPVTSAENQQRSVNAKLSPDDVRAIRALKGKVRGYEIAERFGVTQAQISHILVGRSWKDVT